MTSRTEHRLRLSFDPDYTERWEELESERKVLIKVTKEFYEKQHPMLWFTIVGVSVAFIVTREPALIGPLILPVIMLFTPIGYGLIQYAAKRRRLGL
jgi:hypothetical protein